MPYETAQPATRDSLFEPAAGPVETAEERRDRKLQAAYAFSEATIAAGQGAGRRQREMEDAAAAKVPRSASERTRAVTHSIAPWLYSHR